MDIKDRVKLLCKTKKTTFYKVEDELKLGHGSLSKINRHKPNQDRLIALADYFNVSVDYLIYGDPNDPDTLTIMDTHDITKDVNTILAKISHHEDGPMLYEGENLSPESVELFRSELETALRRLKLLNKQKYNPYKNKKDGLIEQ